MAANAVGSANSSASAPVHGEVVRHSKAEDGFLATAVGAAKTHGKERAKQRIIQSELRVQVHAEDPVQQAANVTKYVTSLTLNQQVELLNKLGIDPFTKEGEVQLVNFVNRFFDANGLGAQRPTTDVNDSSPDTTPRRGRDVFFAIALVQFMLAAVKGNQSEMLAGVSAVKLADQGLQSDEGQLSQDENKISSKITDMEHQLDHHVPWWKKLLIPLAIGVGCALLGPVLGAVAEGIGAAISAGLEACSGVADLAAETGAVVAGTGADAGAVAGNVATDAGTVATNAGAATATAAGSSIELVDMTASAVDDVVVDGDAADEGGAAALQEGDANETTEDQNRITRTEEDGNASDSDNGKTESNRERFRRWKEARIKSITSGVGRYLPGMKSVMFGGAVGMATNTPVQQALAGNPQGQIALDQSYVSLAGTDSQKVELQSKQNSNAVQAVQQEQIQSAMQSNQTLGSEISQALQAISIIGSLGQV